ncbi:hypothetical protein H5410_059741 [Solanum commersonii]|uniref:Uncharacterized protein n=1 Tax=Solanum commersonii TaxID=4109 RepID=A0A9J5W3K8_SOLCO|nr:hypothetical protein H5410_059741 [Solanum commersonii]
MSLFQTEVRFLGHPTCQGKVTPIQRSIDFASKFPDVITDRTGNNPRGRGRSSPKTSLGSLYGSSSNSPVLQRGGMSLISSKISQASSSVRLEDIPENSPLYVELQAYLS